MKKPKTKQAYYNTSKQEKKEKKEKDQKKEKNKKSLEIILQKHQAP